METSSRFRALSTGTVKRQLRALQGAVVLAFVSDLVMHEFVRRLPSLSPFREALVEALLLSALMFATLYVFLFRPNARHAAEREAIELTLVNSEEKLSAIFRTMAEGVALNEIVYDERGTMIDYRILEVNDAFYTIADFRGQDVVGRLATDIYGMSADMIASFWQTHRSRDQVQHTEMLSPLNGRWFYVSTSPFVNDRFVTSFLDITDRKQAEAALVSSLKDKDALLKEVHHRVKNNLQVITSLLRLESARGVDAATKAVLGDMQGRIRSMALLHESLYRSGAVDTVDLSEYLRQLAGQTVRAGADRPGAIQLRFDMISARVPMDQAMPCGLLMNELISNSLKHGFPDGRSGEIGVELQRVAGARLQLRVHDNGVGLPEDFEARRAQSLGLQLVADLARQLRGELVIGPARAAAFTLTFTPAELATSPAPD
jgi:two-component sensor histidine kinase/PAS domain-containing protein